MRTKPFESVEELEEALRRIESRLFELGRKDLAAALQERRGFCMASEFLPYIGEVLQRVVAAGALDPPMQSLAKLTIKRINAALAAANWPLPSLAEIWTGLKELFCSARTCMAKRDPKMRPRQQRPLVEWVVRQKRKRTPPPDTVD